MPCPRGGTELHPLELCRRQAGAAGAHSMPGGRSQAPTLTGEPRACVQQGEASTDTALPGAFL